MAEYDFVVLGGGSAGYAAARTAAAAGLKTLVLEGGDEVGGLCILRGCMPSKTLIESGNRMLAIRDAGEFGLSVTDAKPDIPAVIARKKSLIGEFADYRREQLASGSFDFLRGRGRFVSSGEIQVDLREGGSRRITSSSFLIATGSDNMVPPIPGLAESNPLTSDDILELEHLPESIVVLGAGPVALEMAHYLHAMGVRVTIVQRSPQFLSGTDPDVANVVEEVFRQRGMEVYTGTKLVGIEGEAGARRIRFHHEGREICLQAAALFNGLGRAPVTAGLGLEAAGIKLEGRAIATGLDQATSVPHIFAAGDCCGPYEIVHIAVRQGEIAATNAVRLIRGEGSPEQIDYRLKLYAIFTEPQVGIVGLTETEAREQGIDVLCARYPFADHGKSLVMGERHGFVKLIVAKESREILGGAVVGPHASDLIHEVVVAMEFHATAAQFAAIPHYHPTLSEIWTYPAEELA